MCIYLLDSLVQWTPVGRWRIRRNGRGTDAPTPAAPPVRWTSASRRRCHRSGCFRRCSNRRYPADTAYLYRFNWKIWIFFFFLKWAAVDVAWPTSTLFVVLQDGPAQFWQAILHAVDIDRRRILRTVTDRHPEHNRLTTCIIRKYCGVRKRERENEFAFKANNLIRFDMQIIVLLANWLASGSSTLLD